MLLLLIEDGDHGDGLINDAANDAIINDDDAARNLRVKMCELEAFGSKADVGTKAEAVEESEEDDHEQPEDLEDLEDHEQPEELEQPQEDHGQPEDLEDWEEPEEPEEQLGIGGVDKSDAAAQLQEVRAAMAQDYCARLLRLPMARLKEMEMAQRAQRRNAGAASQRSSSSRGSGGMLNTQISNSVIHIHNAAGPAASPAGPAGGPSRPSPDGRNGPMPGDRGPLHATNLPGTRVQSATGGAESNKWLKRRYEKIRYRATKAVRDKGFGVAEQRIAGIAAVSKAKMEDINAGRAVPG